MALPCYGTPGTYTPATTATLLTDASKASGTPATGDFVLVEWPSSVEGSSHTVTVYTDGTLTDGGSVSGKVGQVVRLESGDNGRKYVPVRGAACIHIAASSAIGTNLRAMVGRW